MVGVSDFMFCICCLVFIQFGDYVWVDKNVNGVQDVCEVFVKVMLISFYDGSGILLVIIILGVDGYYYFIKYGIQGENWLLEIQVLF